MISALRKTPAIAAENTIPDDESAPDLRQPVSLRLCTVFIFYTTGNKKPAGTQSALPVSFFLFCTAPTEAKLSLLPGYEFYLLHAASDAIPLDLISFQLQEKAAAVAAVLLNDLRPVAHMHALLR